jgi:hypothetical protein
VVRLLLENGADINAQGEYCVNALTEASFEGHEQVVRLLLENGADVNTQGGDGSKALTEALLRGHKQVVRLLLENGAYVNVEGEKYSRVLQAAAIGGYEQVVRQLLDNGADVNAQDRNYGSTFNGIITMNLMGREWRSRQIGTNTGRRISIPTNRHPAAGRNTISSRRHLNSQCGQIIISTRICRATSTDMRKLQTWNSGTLFRYLKHQT